MKGFLWDADDVTARRMTAKAEARLIRDLAVKRARTATARQYMPSSVAHINAVRRNRNA